MRDVLRSRFPRLASTYRARIGPIVARDRRHPAFSRWARTGIALRTRFATDAVTFDAAGVWIRDGGLEWLYDPDIWLSALGKEIGMGYDQPEIDHIRGRLGPGGAFVDVGAHVGGYSMPIARTVPTASIHAIEPVPDTRAILERNLARNGLTERVQIWPVAISAAAGRISMSTSMGGANRLVTDDERFADEITQVEAVTLDGLLLDRCARVDVIKCDIEGGELAALQGAVELLGRDRPDLIVEIDERLTRRVGHMPEDVIAHLSDVGYDPIWPGTRSRLRPSDLAFRIRAGGNVTFAPRE